jgi:hypothetical protein
MYRHCIFCSANLGTNENIEAFPVGQRLAFDPWKGRLWAVCPRCSRWNLAPLEERWEAVEAAERIFRDTRERVQSENVGLARLRDETYLVRIGAALPGELAAWRYGRELRRRRSRYWWRTAGLVALADFGLVVLLVSRHDRSRALLHQLMPTDSPTGTEVHIQARHLRGALLTGGSSADGLRLIIPGTVALPHAAGEPFRGGPSVTLEGETARAVVSRFLVQVNRRGAPPGKLRQALELLTGAGSAEAYLTHPGHARASPEGALRFRSRFGRMIVEDDGPVTAGRPAPDVAALALEMALHEEAERRALDEELTTLKAAWREAEEIAGIADSLP